MSHPSLGSRGQGPILVSTYQRQVVLSRVAGHKTVPFRPDARATDGTSRRHLRLYRLATMIGITQAEAVMTIEMQRPERRNALNSQLVDELREAVQKAAHGGRPRHRADRPGHGVLRRRGPERRRLRRRLPGPAHRTAQGHGRGADTGDRRHQRPRHRRWPAVGDASAICGSSHRMRFSSFRRRNTVWLLITGASAGCRRWWATDAPARCC